MHTALFVLLVQIAFAGAVNAIGKISQALAIILWFAGEAVVWAGVFLVSALDQQRDAWGIILVFVIMAITCILGTVIIGGDILGSLQSFTEFCLDHVTEFVSNAYAGLIVCAVCVAILVYALR
jgi:hypothetical protein